MRAQDGQINISAIPVAGIGGLGMVALAAIIAVAFPLARWLLVGGIVSGVAIAAVLILVRRGRHARESGGLRS